MSLPGHVPSIASLCHAQVEGLLVLLNALACGCTSSLKCLQDNVCMVISRLKAGVRLLALGRA